MKRLAALLIMLLLFTPALAEEAALVDSIIYDGSVTVSNVWQLITGVNTTNSNGDFDPSLITEGGTFTVEFAGTDKGVYLAAFALAVLGVLSLLRRGTKKGGPALLLSFLLCGYYAVHLIVEVQARYRYFLLPTVFVLAGYGLALLTKEE